MTALQRLLPVATVMSAHALGQIAVI